MNRPGRSPSRGLVGQFTVSYGTVNRLWCNRCNKHENLPDLANETVRRLEHQHECGPRTSAWSSRSEG